MLHSHLLLKFFKFVFVFDIIATRNLFLKNHENALLDFVQPTLNKIQSGYSLYLICTRLMRSQSIVCVQDVIMLVLTDSTSFKPSSDQT